MPKKKKDYSNVDYVVYDCFGSIYTFIELRTEAGVLVGTCTRNHKKTWLWEKYIQFDDAYPAPAMLIEKHILDERLKNLPN